MKICLINPPWFIRKANVWNQARGTLPSLGLLYLASFLERERIDVDLIDFQSSFRDWETTKHIIKSKRYDIYGITATTPIVNSGYRISEIIKALYPDVKVVFGGVHVTALPEEALSKKSVDFVIRGEGEESFLKLIQRAPVENIPGLSYKENGNFRHVKPAGWVMDLDSIPFPAFHKINLRAYHPAASTYKRLPAINMLTSRGCNGRCTFCCSANIPLRVRSAGNIFEEMQMLSREYKIREISFYDDNFSVNKENVEKLCDLLIKNKIDLTWSCFSRTDCVNLSLLKKMKAAGCHQIMYGIEAVDDVILRNINKNTGYNQNKTAVELAKRAGIEVRCAFMFGNPGETIRTINNTIRYSAELNPDIALYNIATPYPGTEMFIWAKKNNYLIHENWNEYDFSSPVMNLPTITPELVESKYKRAYGYFYSRPGFIIRKLIGIWSLKNSLRLLNELRVAFNFLKFYRNRVK